MPDETRKTILLVEDEAIVAMAEKLILEEYGYRVLTVGTGEAAVAAVGETAGIDLILMDINLGAGIDGTEAAAAILRTRDLPIVFLSSHTEPETVARTEKITSYGYVVKDSNSTVLDAAIKMAFKLFDAKIKELQREKALAESRDLLISLARLVPGVIYQYRLYPDGRSAFPYASPGMVDIYEVTPEEVRLDATPVFGRLHPDDYDQIVAAIQESARTLSTFTSEFRVILPRQGLRWRWSQAHPERMADGGTLWHGIISDITERKEAEIARADVESRFRLLFEQSPDGIVIIDPTTARIVEFNETAHRQLGYTRREFAGLAIPDIEAAETAEETERHISQIMKEGYDVFPTRHRARSGEMRDIQVTARFTEIGGRPLYHCLWRDVTDNLRAQAELKESEERLRDILFSMADWVWEVDARGVYTYSSEKGVSLLGASREDIIGKTPFDFMLPKEAARVAPLLSALVAAKSPIVDLENWNIAKDGRLVCLLTSGVPILDEAGELKGYRGVDRDITERKQAEMEIQRQLDEKDVLLKEVHHRIKNNIASISGFLTLHLRSTVNPEAAEALRDAIGRVDSMRILYDTLLLGEGYTDLSVKTYVEKLADTIVAMFPDRARLTLLKRMDDFPLEPRRLFPLGIIINELLTNAMKYAFTDRESGTLEVALTATDGRAVLIVQDDGPGLPAGFEIRDSKGFGIMLVQMLCQQLGGVLHFENRGGARFRVEFPL